MLIRRASPDDADLLHEVGEVTVAAYSSFLLGPSDPYVPRLRDARARADEAELWVAGSAEHPHGRSEALGSVTLCPPGSPWREIAAEGEGEFRMLAVAPGAQGQGVGGALVEHVLERCREAGDAAVVLSSLPQMGDAHRLYARHGFVRVPERDWSPVPSVHLVVFRRPL
ncbi:GNAT family N-acetyltransferase [Nocardioides bruguierae]|uniref:GNAT family N-acetyltransferase n=1 Tax=Nocardioides bruguierae TaxID=2945102 RepID=UPI00201FF1EE|nr:GNAT family N-acetyltransferase [Nocardioides bruguierae]MCL8024815.1 GNAT family N-acetyltransferase [Nocardioides bruguierae]